ncbi:MAG TPA: hypothetical protein VG389_26980, partial [Myxococcota bacterium]|nr:hypothetical protein [Myxococcota bacterium]
AIYAPAGWTNEALPAVVTLHGYGAAWDSWNADTTLGASSGLRTKADTLAMTDVSTSFFVVDLESDTCEPGAGVSATFCDAVGPAHGWNSGIVPRYDGHDDVQWIRDVVELVRTSSGITVGSVYAVGNSNGGQMVHRLASEDPSLFSAHAVVDGNMSEDYRCDGKCIPGDPAYQEGMVDVDGTVCPEPLCSYDWDPTQPPDTCVLKRVADATAPVPIVIIHGVLDTSIHIDGTISCRPGHDPLPIAASVDKWLTINGCATANPGTDFVTTVADGIDRREFVNCTSGIHVLRYILDNQQHVWGSGDITTSMAGTTVTDLVWDFLKDY